MTTAHSKTNLTKDDNDRAAFLKHFKKNLFRHSQC